MYNIFITFVLFFENSSGLKPMLDRYAELQSCVAHTIQNIFNENNSLLFLSEYGDEFAFPDTIINPYVIANTDGLKHPNQIAEIFSNDENIVLHLKQFGDMTKFTKLLRIFSNWPQENTFLLVIRKTSANTIKIAFELLWKCNFFNVVVIGYGENFHPSLIYSDEFAIANECGRKFENYVIGDCNSTRKHQFPNVLRKYPNCNVLYGNLESWMHYKELKETYVTFRFLQTIAYALNMSFSRHHYKINFTDGSYLAIYKTNNYKSDLSIKDATVFYYEDMVWNVPAPKRISPLAVLKITFKPLLWLFVVLAFFSTSTLWWLLGKLLKEHHNSYFEVFFGVYSITLFGLSLRVPRTWALRYAFITYVIYAIHIQTAFTSNLIQILTVAQYEPRINSLQDLAESDLPILIRDDTFTWLNSIETKSPLHKKIYDKFIVLTPIRFHDAILQKNLTNTSILWNYDLFNYYESGTTKSSFSGYSIVNLWPGFNRAVSVLFEAGFVDSYINTFQKINTRYYYEQGFVNIQNGNKIVITLEHLSSIFAVWILGLFLGIIVFVIEFLVCNW
ncbi:hypothetical protein FQR65_LT08697 [Abscondita terminalis]|nr:hypothetical protein FQR65_LT08697 [Abscondita terminalis]